MQKSGRTSEKKTLNNSQRRSQFQAQIYNHWQHNPRESRLIQVDTIINMLPPGKMLDIGCSDGSVSEVFIKKNWEVHGLDSAKDKIALACKKGLQARVANVEETLPYKAKTFDLILCLEVIEHVLDTSFLLKECFRVLKPTGTLVVSTPNLASLENRLRIFFGMQPLWVDFKAEKSSGHIRAYTFGALKEQLTEVGFSQIQLFGNFIPLWQLRFNDLSVPWLKYTGNLYPKLAQDLIVVIKK